MFTDDDPSDYRIKLTVGTAFRPDFDPKNHVHFIASSTDQPHVVVMNFTTVKRFSDMSCVLTAGDHETILHDTCVYYAKAQILEVAAIERGIMSGTMTQVATLSSDVLQRVWDGVSISRQTPNECVAVLRQQKLII